MSWEEEQVAMFTEKTGVDVYVSSTRDEPRTKDQDYCYYYYYILLCTDNKLKMTHRCCLRSRSCHRKASIQECKCDLLQVHTL